MTENTNMQKVSKAPNHLDAPCLEAQAPILYIFGCFPSFAFLKLLHRAWVYILNPKYP